MTGAVEEVGKATGSFIDVMKREPLSLALVLMNVLLLGFLYYDTATVQSSRLDTVKLILDQQKQVHELLARCIVPERQQRSELSIEPVVPLPKPRPLNEDPPKPGRSADGLIIPLDPPDESPAR